MDKKDELLKRIKEIKHDFGKLVPTTIELMFDACVGILYEEYAIKMAEFDARDKASSGGRSAHLGLLRANAERELKQNVELVQHLKDRVTAIYVGAKNESEKNKEKERKGASQSDGLGAAPSGGEGGSGGG
jgi:hypothetical protein